MDVPLVWIPTWYCEREDPLEVKRRRVALYLKKHPVSRRKYALRIRDVARSNRLKLISFFGGKCIRCGFDNVHALHFDHINGGGNKDRQRFSGNGAMLVSYYLKHQDEARATLQLLCANCNTLKQYEQREITPMRYE
jgi:hypothetical protein